MAKTQTKAEMERMHEIMKARIEDDKAFARFKELRQGLINSLNSEMAIVGPIKIGDIVHSKGGSHHGKKMIVDDLWVNNDWRGVGIRAEGRLLKKDGTPGLRTARYFIKVAVAP